MIDKHLEFIQNIITRMNTNSFQIKSLAITIVAAFLGIYASTQLLSFILIGLFPTLILWFLDSYYLQQERKFRGLYNDVAGIASKNVIKPFGMPINLYNGGSFSYCNVLFSKTILGFYLPIILLLIISFTIIFFSKNCIIINC